MLPALSLIKLLSRTPVVRGNLTSAVIGGRSAVNPDVFRAFERFGMGMGSKGYTIRTGSRQGVEAAALSGARSVKDKLDIIKKMTPSERAAAGIDIPEAALRTLDTDDLAPYIQRVARGEGVDVQRTLIPKINRAQAGFRMPSSQGLEYQYTKIPGLKRERSPQVLLDELLDADASVVKQQRRGKKVGRKLKEQREANLKSMGIHKSQLEFLTDAEVAERLAKASAMKKRTSASSLIDDLDIEDQITTEATEALKHSTSFYHQKLIGPKPSGPDWANAGGFLGQLTPLTKRPSKVIKAPLKKSQLETIRKSQDTDPLHGLKQTEGFRFPGGQRAGDIAPSSTIPTRGGPVELIPVSALEGDPIAAALVRGVFGKKLAKQSPRFSQAVTGNPTEAVLRLANENPSALLGSRFRGTIQDRLPEARNVADLKKLLGQDVLDPDPVDFLTTFSQAGDDISYALKAARDLDIPTINLADPRSIANLDDVFRLPAADRASMQEALEQLAYGLS